MLAAVDQQLLTVEAELWLDGPLNGGSQAHHLRCAGGTEYAVKFMGNPQGNMVLARELGFGRAARLLGETTPEVAIVEITQAFLDVTPQIPFRQPGLAVGSRWVAGAFDTKLGGATGPFLPEDLARVIIFQTWAAGQNQDPAGLVEITTGRTWSVDHGYYCYPNTIPAPPDTGPGGVVVPGGLQPAAAIGQARDKMDPVLDLLEQLTFDSIIGAFAGAPYVWGTGAQERAEMAHYLGRRQHLVRGFLAPLRGGTP